MVNDSFGVLMYKSPQDFEDFNQSLFKLSKMKFFLLFTSILAISSAAPSIPTQDSIGELFTNFLMALLSDESLVQMMISFNNHPESFSKMSKIFLSENSVSESSFKGTLEKALSPRSLNFMCDEDEMRIEDCEEMKIFQENFSKIRVDLLSDPFNKLMSGISHVAHKKMSEAHKPY